MTFADVHDRPNGEPPVNSQQGPERRRVIDRHSNALYKRGIFFLASTNPFRDACNASEQQQAEDGQWCFDGNGDGEVPAKTFEAVLTVKKCFAGDRVLEDVAEAIEIGFGEQFVIADDGHDAQFENVVLITLRDECVP